MGMPPVSKLSQVADGRVVAFELWEVERADQRALSSSREGAEPGDRLADDHVLHLEGALVRVERLGIVEEASDVVVDENAVAAQELSRPGYRLTRLGGGERLRQRRLLVRELAFVRELRRANDHALAGGDVGKHAG